MKRPSVLLAFGLLLPWWTIRAAEEKRPGSQPKLPTASRATNAVVARGPKIEGEQFRMRQIVDSAQGGLPVSIFSAPDTWRDRSQVVWTYEHMSNPVNASASVENPVNPEAFYLHPAVVCFCLRPDGGYFRPGQNVNGLIYTAQPLAPAAALAVVVKQLRGSSADFAMVGQRELPELAKALQLTTSAKARGVGVKATYKLAGKPIEEEFYAVYDSLEIPYDGPQGRSWQINWGMSAIHSFRAPEGTLDGRRPVFTAIAKSFRPNPGWLQRVAAVNAYLAEEFNRQMQAGYDRIAAAGAMSRQISANNDAMIASIDRKLAASKSSGGSTSVGSGRSGTDDFSDYIRGVDTVKDPYYGTSQHSSTEQYHWTDGYGSYRHSNDASADPNHTEIGTWQRMELAR